MRNSYLIILLLISSVSSSFAQSGIRDSVIRFPFLGISYGVMKPGGDLADRFGNSSMLGFNTLYKNNKNWLFGFTGGFIFGNKIKQESALEGISTGNGQIIGLDGLYADVRLFERGYHISFSFGKIFNFKKPNPNSGIIITAGPGFLQHKIRIETIGNSVPSLNKEYLKGYDHLTNGWELNEFIGYIYFSNRQLVNFFGGIEFIQGFTSNRRDYNFNDSVVEPKNRHDLMYGVKLGWVIPLYKKKPNAFYLY